EDKYEYLSVYFGIVIPHIQHSFVSNRATLRSTPPWDTYCNAGPLRLPTRQPPRRLTSSGTPPFTVFRHRPTGSWYRLRTEYSYSKRTKLPGVYPSSSPLLFARSPGLIWPSDTATLPTHASNY